MTSGFTPSGIALALLLAAPQTARCQLPEQLERVSLGTNALTRRSAMPDCGSSAPASTPISSRWSGCTAIAKSVAPKALRR